MNLFTPEDLLEYYYQETSPERSNAIASALQSSWALRQKYEVICEAAAQLDTSVLAPLPKTVQAIIDYAAHEAAANV
jgi:hypothetical protein